MISGLETFSPLADETELDAIAANGYKVARVEAPVALSAGVLSSNPPAKAVQDLTDYYATTKAQYAKFDLTCHWVIEPQEAPYVLAGSSVDFMNEMNVGWRGKPRMTAAHYRAELETALDQLLPRGVTVYAAVASDTDTSAVAWTKAILAGLPPEVRACYHRYPNQNDPTKPKKGWKTRAAESAGILDANGGRPFIVSECCYPSQVPGRSTSTA